MSLFDYSTAYKPIQYVWALDLARRHEAIHWIEDEVELGVDVEQWNRDLTEAQRKYVAGILRMFTTSDVNVARSYYDYLIPIFKNNEIRNMLGSFAAREAIHQRAYALLNDTLGLDESEYSAFLYDPVLKSKNDFMLSEETTLKEQLAKQIFSEGVLLFGSFAMLLNFQRQGLMPGMVTITRWSLREECFVAGTEVLTVRGWKKIEDLIEGEEIAQWGSDGSIDFTTPSRIVSYDKDEELVRLSSQYGLLDQFVTKNHDIPVYSYSYRTGKEIFKKVKAPDLVCHSQVKVPVAGLIQGTIKELTNEQKFLIALQADGSIIQRKDTHKPVAVFNLKRRRKKDRLTHLLDELGWEYTKSDSSMDVQNFYIKVPESVSLTKCLSDWVNLKNLDHKWCEAFIQEIAEWDGHRRPEGSIIYSCKNITNCEIVQIVGSLCGYKAKLYLPNYKENYDPVYRVSLVKQQTVRTKCIKKEFVPYRGKVYCVTVPKGNIVMRYNNTVSITGNSMHVQGLTKLYNSLKDRVHMANSLYDLAQQTYDQEAAFISYVFNNYSDILGLAEEEVKTYIKYLIDRRLIQMGVKGYFNQRDNPLPWVDDLIGVERLENFFETRVTEYNSSGMTGEWGY